ncbi:MAG: cell division protein FtsQ [Chitinispirillia bacterium]|nr:cell division protein FtsQ [Chitinispirillia bacterium]MCL2267800.1 cell division protein FtsQ [Chitinispirillia bacterium]
MAERLKNGNSQAGAKQRTEKSAGSGKRRIRRPVKVALVIAFAASVAVVVFLHGPLAFDSVAESINAGKRVSAKINGITNCSGAVRDTLRRALEPLMAPDTCPYSRAAVEKIALEIPAIEKVSIKKVKDRQSRQLNITIKVTERKPVALVHCGKISLVDKYGVRFPAEAGRYYDALPLLVVGTPESDTLKHEIEFFNRVMKASRNLGDSFLNQISQIDISNSDEVNLIFKSGEAEYLLDPDDIEDKLVRVKSLRQKLLQDEGDPMRIDMRYRHIAVVLAQK